GPRSGPGLAIVPSTSKRTARIGVPTRERIQSATIVESLSEAIVDPGRGRAFHALRSRDFRLLWSGQTVSLIGNAAFFVAIGWRTQALTGSSRSLAFVLLLYSLSMLATLLVGGALADRYERRRLMIVSDLSRFVVVAALAAVDASGHLSLPLLLGFAAAV